MVNFLRRSKASEKFTLLQDGNVDDRRGHRHPIKACLVIATVCYLLLFFVVNVRLRNDNDYINTASKPFLLEEARSLIPFHVIGLIGFVTSITLFMCFSYLMQTQFATAKSSIIFSFSVMFAVVVFQFFGGLANAYNTERTAAEMSLPEWVKERYGIELSENYSRTSQPNINRQMIIDENHVLHFEESEENTIILIDYETGKELPPTFKQGE